MKRAGILGLAIVLIAGLAIASPATGKAKRITSEVEIDGLGPPTTYNSFVGDVHSRKSKCERNRTVTLYYEEAGQTEQLGSDTTDETGDWVLPIVVIGDDPYYVVVDRKKVGKGDKKLICKADTSPRAAPPPL
jgi:hypothetical protein